jgi:hypothetical protein
MWEHWPFKELWSTMGKKNEENLWIMVRTWTRWHFIKRWPGTSNLEEGAVVAFGE